MYRSLSIPNLIYIKPNLNIQAHVHTYILVCNHEHWLSNLVYTVSITNRYILINFTSKALAPGQNFSLKGHIVNISDFTGYIWSVIHSLFHNPLKKHF